jgi:restriction endonuclease
MIILDIILEDEKKAGEISEFLIKQKYAIQTHIDTNTILTATGQKKTIRLFFITKALLYSIIEHEVKKNFFSKEMIIYASPVSHINEEFGDLLRASIKAI